MSAISVKLFQAIVAGAAAQGVAPPVLLGAAGIAPEDLADPDGRLPRSAEVRLWNEAVRLTGDEAFGIHLSELLDAADHGALGFAVRSSATVGEAYQRIARFLRVVVHDVTLSVELHGPTAILRHTPPPGDPPPSRHAVESLLTNLLIVGRRGTGTAFVPREVRLRHAAPARTDEHHRVFGPGLRFSRPHDEVVLDRDWLALPLEQAEPTLAQVLDRHLQEEVARQPSPAAPADSFLDRVRGCMAAELSRGEPTLESIARRLHMSPRSLQRRLQQEGSSLQSLLGRLRADLAVRYLSEHRESISEVAFLLGFSEVSTFHRAFKRWTGLTPAAYRRGRRAAAAVR